MARRSGPINSNLFGGGSISGSDEDLEPRGPRRNVEIIVEEGGKFDNSDKDIDGGKITSAIQPVIVNKLVSSE